MPLLYTYETESVGDLLKILADLNKNTPSRSHHLWRWQRRWATPTRSNR